MTLPILTLTDPKISGEGALDPLGVATISDRLANLVLPGLRARMSRPRFLTAMAVCAAVCEGIEDEVAPDGTTPAYVVFEWLIVEGFARAAKREHTFYTPGMLKAQAARDSGEPMRASAYLRVPTIFGFHGIYKPLARQAGIIDENMRLGETGHTLLKEWQGEQGLTGFLRTAAGAGPGTTVRGSLRSAVQDALKKGCTDRGSQWRGWSEIAEHLAPGRIGVREAALIHQLLFDGKAGTRGEVCRLIEGVEYPEEMTEAELVTKVLMPNASPDLHRRLRAVVDFETACTLLETALEWIRYLSSQAGARAITSTQFAASDAVREIATALPETLEAAESSIGELDNAILLQQHMADLAKSFDHARTAGDLFEAVLARHHEVQQGKAPEGKRDWFERSPDGSTFVRVPYRTTEAPAPKNSWNRPYRFDTVRSFLTDLQGRGV